MAFEQGGVWSWFSISASVALKVSTYYRCGSAVLCSSGGKKLSCTFKDLPSGSSYTTCRDGSGLSSSAWLRLFKPGRGSSFTSRVLMCHLDILKVTSFWMDRESRGRENFIDQSFGRKDRMYMWTVSITTFWSYKKRCLKYCDTKNFFNKVSSFERSFLRIFGDKKSEILSFWSMRGLLVLTNLFRGMTLSYRKLETCCDVEASMPTGPLDKYHQKY